MVGRILHPVFEHAGPQGLISKGNDVSEQAGLVLETAQLASCYVEILGPTQSVISTATAFVTRSGQLGKPHVVTARHVVTGRHQETGQPLDQQHGALPAALDVYHLSNAAPIEWTAIRYALGGEEGQPLWLEHPELGGAMDVIAIPIDFDLEAEFGLDLATYNLDGTPADTAIARDVFTVGFPVGVEPSKNNLGGLGVWSRGSVATDPRMDWKRLPAFLIDSRTREGQSGSPVINRAISHGGLSPLLGLYSGRIHKDSDLGIVWRREALMEVCANGVCPTDPWVGPLEIE